VLAGVAVLGGCGGDDEAADVTTTADAGTKPTGDPTELPPPGSVTPDEAAALATADGVTIIDVRTPAEYDEGHLAGAELVDLSAGTFATEISEYDPAGRYLVYCRSGNRSAQAVQIMAELGFEQVWDMGGIVDWQAAGHPVVT
jgi:phage shock protein E